MNEFFVEEDEDEEEDTKHVTQTRQQVNSISTPKGSITGTVKYEIVDTSGLRSIFLGKVVNFQSRFEFAHLAEGFFLETLRKSMFVDRAAASRLDERIIDMMDDSKYLRINLDRKKLYMCNILCDEFSVDQIRHFGCGHTFEEDCMKEYLTEQINNKGPQSIETRCPYDGCDFIATQNIVDQSCEKHHKELFNKFTLDDFIFRAPFIVPCFA